MSWEYLPQDTARVVPQQVKSCQNLGLLFDRFNPWGRSRDTWDLQFERGRNTTDRQRWLQALACQGFDEDLLEAHYARWRTRVQGQRAKVLTLITQSRLLIGLGHPHVLETALTLHRLYGFPIIPGSALKGLTRAYHLACLALSLGVPPLPLEEYWDRELKEDDTPLSQLAYLLEQLPRKEAEVSDALLHAFGALQRDPALPDDAALKRMSLQEFRRNPDVRTFQAIFGTLDRVGWVVFCDAVPQGGVTMTLDIMNPHYPQHYRGAEAPHDADSPTPIQFLAVERNVSFGFALAPRRPGERRHRQAVEVAADTMVRALRTVGIGAKTGSGYGRFGRSHSMTAFSRGPDEPPIPRPTPGLRRQ